MSARRSARDSSKANGRRAARRPPSTRRAPVAPPTRHAPVASSRRAPITTSTRREPVAASTRREPVAPLRAVSLSRALSKLSVASRTEAEKMILEGRVSIGTRVIRDPRWRVDPNHDDIRVDGRSVRPPQPQFWLLHKPVGIITTRRDERSRPTVYDLLPPDLPHVVPVGRLDGDSSGLLLLTNDTQLAARLTDPESHIPKVYEVELDAPIGAAEVRRLSEGVPIAGRMTRPAIVELLRGRETPHARVTLIEGRNRQVRRMFRSIGRTVIALRRVAIGPLHIRGLAEGQVRPLRPREIESLLAIKAARAPRG